MTKRLIAVISGLLVLPAFAEVAPLYYDSDVIEYADIENVDDVATVATDADEINQKTDKSTAKSAVASRTSRNISRVVPATVNSQTTSNSRRATASRGVSSRTAARTATTTNRIATTRAAATDNATNNVATRSNAMRSSAATKGRVATIQTTKNTLYNPTTTASRIGLRTNAGVASRVPAVRIASVGSATTPTTQTMSAADVASSMNDLAELTDYCKARYMECMDNFCNVLDDNQGRCSCSKNIKNYEKTETALKDATEALQDVASQIQYIGLSASDVETLFTQTEAELKMSSTTDSTKLKTDLDRVKNMIVGVKSGTAGVSDVSSDMSFDLSGLLDFNFSSTGFDLGSLFGGVTQSTSGISNQRGETLYKTAAARCKSAVLNTCQNQGVDPSLIVNSYDMEIDRQCVAYERSLIDANDQMVATVRNAKTVLQKARLMVAQNKNAYDLRGCVNALDACMQDDYVCGSDYEYCLDPSGKYIVNGEIVKGGEPGIAGGEYGTAGAGNATGSGVAVRARTSVNGNAYTTNIEAGGLYSTWDYSTNNNAWAHDGNLADFINNTIYSASGAISAPNSMTQFLQSKIGYIDNDGKAVGMCASVLNKCQDYSFSGTGNNRKYKSDNSVVRAFLERALIQIKAKQDEVIANYAESCITDVSTCLNNNNYSYANNATYYSTTSSDNPSNIAIQACMTIIQSCKSATTPTTETYTVYQWLDSALGSALALEREMCETDSDTTWNTYTGRCECSLSGYYLTQGISFGQKVSVCVAHCGEIANNHTPDEKNVISQNPYQNVINGRLMCSACPSGQTAIGDPLYDNGTCSDTQYHTKNNCENANETWTPDYSRYCCSTGGTTCD